MVRAERTELHPVVSRDERDHAILLSLLEHKILTTHQIKNLFFRSFRRCQHRLKELRDLGFVSSFSVGRGFGEGGRRRAGSSPRSVSPRSPTPRACGPRTCHMDPRRELPVEPHARSPPWGHRVLLRARRGLQCPRPGAPRGWRSWRPRNPNREGRRG
ncbi:MAG: replication-relaxation family protein [Actinomycetota bacterium]